MTVVSTDVAHTRRIRAAQNENPEPVSVADAEVICNANDYLNMLV